MYAVIMYHTFEHDTPTYLFEEYEDAKDYLKYLWEEYYREELRNHSKLNEERCFYTTEYAKVEWEDKEYTDFILTYTSEPEIRIKTETIGSETVKIILNRDEETPVSIEGNLIRADWYESGEGLFGDYNPNNPNDKELLRFDIYKKENNDWVEVEDASYCTNTPANTNQKILIALLKNIWKEYNNVLASDPDKSVKKLGETLSWIKP